MHKRGRFGIFMPAGRGGSRGRSAGGGFARGDYRRFHRPPYRAGLGLRVCGIVRAAPAGDCRGKRIAVPGCHASGFIALVYPLVAAGVMGADYPVVCHSVTGYSGGGKKMIAQYQADGREAELSSPRQYGLSQRHKHLKEMQAVCGLDSAPVFMPVVADFYSGMVVTVPVFTGLLKKRMDLNALGALFEAHYARAEAGARAAHGRIGSVSGGQQPGGPRQHGDIYYRKRRAGAFNRPV